MCVCMCGKITLIRIAISGECCWNNYVKYVDIRTLLLLHSVYKTCPLSALRCDWWIKLIRDSNSSNILFTCFSCQYSWTNLLLNDIFSSRLSVFSCSCFCSFNWHLHFFYFCILLAMHCTFSVIMQMKCRIESQNNYTQSYIFAIMYETRDDLSNTYQVAL